MMAKKSAGRNVGKSHKRSWQRTESRAEAPDAVAPVEPAPESSARQPVQLRRPTSPGGAYSPRRDRRSAATVATPLDYSYVLKDLRRVGILVGIIVTVLVILTIFLR